MRIAVVSDIHGNLTALEAVLADLRVTSPDVIFHGGDLAHGGARPAEAVDRIRELGWPGVCGNTDEMLWAPERLEKFASTAPNLGSLLGTIREMIPETCARLGEDRLRWMEALPHVERRAGLAILHASPEDLWRAPMPEASDEELTNLYGPLDAPVVVYGHIHRPYVRELACMTVANTGSVSLSYDRDVRASYLLVDESRVASEKAKASIRRVEYDVESEIEALQNSGLPHTEWVARNLRAGQFVAA